jgi:hypothetical protein
MIVVWLLCRLLQLPLASVRPPVEDEGGYTGVQAPKRKRVQETPVVEEAPPKVNAIGGMRLSCPAVSLPSALVWYSAERLPTCTYS